MQSTFKEQIQNSFMEGNTDKQIFQPHLFNKLHLEGSPENPEFFLHGRHVFVMTNVGRPIFVRYGDEIKVIFIFSNIISKSATFLATLNAILQKYLIFFSGDKTKQQLFKVSHHNLMIYFLQRKQITLVCASKSVEDSDFLIFQMLEFLNSQIISSVTDNVNIQLESRPNYDLRNLLSGTNNLLNLAIKNGINSPCIIFNSFCPLSMNASMRGYIHTSLKEFKHSSLLCSIIMTDLMIIDIYKRKDIEIKTEDILLVQTLIQAQSQLKKSENWIPICLPGLSAQGMIQAYIHFFHQNVAIFMLSDDSSHDMFFSLKEFSNDLTEKFKNNNMLQTITQCLDSSPTIPKCMENNSTIKHFIVKHVSGQIFLPLYQPYGKQPKHYKQYLHKYAKQYQQFLQYSQQQTQQQNLKENYFSWGSNGFGLSQYHDTIIMFCFDKFIDFTQVSNNVHLIHKTFKTEEIGNYFIVKQN